MNLRVKGFRFSGVHAGLKATEALDLGLLVADEPVDAAGVFTKNLVRAAPVVLSERRLESTGLCRAILVNSGNANACSGAEGRTAALTTSRALARALGSSPKHVLPSSTGVIGVPLPASVVEAAIPNLVSAATDAGAEAFARAIMTTDRGPKMHAVEFRVGRVSCRVLGIAKGAGMIHPNMATTLGFVVTDAAVSSRVLQRSLREVSERTFNRGSVDGDTSTNDSIYALASGQASAKEVDLRTAAGRRFTGALDEVLEALIKMIVADGEGAQHLVRIEVMGARTAADAVQVARTIAGSQLVKTAIYGCDPNWGRILAAAGRSGVRFNPDQVSVAIGKVEIFESGRPTMSKTTERRAVATMKRSEYTILVRLGKGRGLGHYWTCDLGHEYVRINADYRT